MHFGTFDLADEPLDEPPPRFLAEAGARGLGERAFVLAIGETRGVLKAAAPVAADAAAASR